jgi:hypothetical protein
MLNKLARTFASQVEALKKYRSAGEQTIKVQHVTVNDGGQAIVGNVSQRGVRAGAFGTWQRVAAVQPTHGQGNEDLAARGAPIARQVRHQSQPVVLEPTRFTAHPSMSSSEQVARQSFRLGP